MLRSVLSVHGRVDGSGFVFDDDGHVLTTRHIVDVTVTTPDGGRVPAEVVGVPADVAVLRIEQPPTLGRSADVRVGEAVTAIGSPSGTVTTGIVFAVRDRFSRPTPRTARAR